MSGALVLRAAADLLFLTLEKRRTLDQAMAESPPFNDLDGPDRGFARAIASAALRELGRIDMALAPSSPVRCRPRARPSVRCCVWVPSSSGGWMCRNMPRSRKPSKRQRTGRMPARAAPF
jgi:hypothetical protein